MVIAISILGVVTAIPVLANHGDDNEADDRALVQGSLLHGANGIMFDANDQLYIASVFGREIVVMDPETGEITDILSVAQGGGRARRSHLRSRWLALLDSDFYRRGA